MASNRRSALPHQTTAIDETLVTLETHDRARVVMACGTGKTLTQLWTTEH